MAREIEIPKCVNCTDLRPNNKLPEIEIEAIRTYTRSLSEEAINVILEEVKDEALVIEIHKRMFNRKYKLERIGEYLR